jgi:hypothetical protein
MKQLAASLIFAFCVIWPASGEAAYLIRLKNGNEFITGRYWQEGRQLMFDTPGGVFGVDRAFIIRIEQSDQAVKLAVPAQEMPQQKSPAEATEKKGAAKTSTPTEAKLQAKRDDDPISKEFQRLKARSQGVDGLLTSEIRELLKEITALKSRIRSNSKLFIDYAREFNEANEIANVTETALRSRDQ